MKVTLLVVLSLETRRLLLLLLEDTEGQSLVPIGCYRWPEKQDGLLVIVVGRDGPLLLKSGGDDRANIGLKSWLIAGVEQECNCCHHQKRNCNCCYC